MGRGRRVDRGASQRRDEDDLALPIAGGRTRSAAVGLVAGLGVGYFFFDITRDPALLLPIVGGGGLVGALLGFAVGDRVWEYADRHVDRDR